MAGDPSAATSEVNSFPGGQPWPKGRPQGRGTTCDIRLCSFRNTDVVVVGEQWALFGIHSEGVGPHHLSPPEEGAL